MKTQAASTAYSEWLEQYKKDADITVNPMPKDVPYNVSLKGCHQEFDRRFVDD